MSYSEAQPTTTMSQQHRTKQVAPQGCPAGWVWLTAGILIGMFISFLLYLQSLSNLSAQHGGALSPPAAVSQMDTSTQFDSKPQHDTSDSGTHFEFYDMLPRPSVENSRPAENPLQQQTNTLAGLPQRTSQDSRTSNQGNLEPYNENKVADNPISLTQPQPQIPEIANNNVIAVNNRTAGGIVLQIAAFRDLRDAEELQTRLNGLGFSVRLQSAMVNDRRWYRVRLNSVINHPEAANLQARLARHGFSAIIVK